MEPYLKAVVIVPPGGLNIGIGGGGGAGANGVASSVSGGPLTLVAGGGLANGQGGVVSATVGATTVVLQLAGRAGRSMLYYNFDPPTGELLYGSGGEGGSSWGGNGGNSGAAAIDLDDTNTLGYSAQAGQFPGGGGGSLTIDGSAGTGANGLVVVHQH